MLKELNWYKFAIFASITIYAGFCYLPWDSFSYGEKVVVAFFILEVLTGWMLREMQANTLKATIKSVDELQMSITRILVNREARE